MQYRLVISTISAIIAILLTILWFGAMIPTCLRVRGAEDRISQLERDNTQLVSIIARLANNQVSLMEHQAKCLDLAKKSQELIKHTEALNKQIKETSEVCNKVCCRRRP